MPNGSEADDFRVQRYHGKPVLTWCQGGPFGTISPGVDYILNSSYRVVATVRAGNGLEADCHEFLLTPQGTALITASHLVPYDLSSVGGPKHGAVIDGIVQEIDIATGRVLFEWHSLGHVPLTDSYAPVQSPYNYFIINAVTIDSDGNLLISGRATWTVYKVDRHSGRILWRLGGKRSDFRLGPGAHFTGQHDPVAAGTNIIRLFDNGNDARTSTEQDSRVIWLRLNQATKTVTLVKAIHHPQHLSALFEGNAQALANGDTFVGWGTAGYVSEFGPRGNLLFNAHFLNGYDTYRGYRFAWAGRPRTKPSVTARKTANGTTMVHAIWNGATGVAHWRILGGPSASALAPVRMVAWNGLDTTVKIAEAPHLVEVAALDKHGTVLARSLPTTAGAVRLASLPAAWSIA
jgi:hypothetical protein